MGQGWPPGKDRKQDVRGALQLSGTMGHRAENLLETERRKIRLGTPGQWSSVENCDGSWWQRRLSRLVWGGPMPLESSRRLQQSARTEQSPFSTNYAEHKMWQLSGWQVLSWANAHVTWMIYDTYTSLSNTELTCLRFICPMHMDSMPLYLLRKHIPRAQVPVTPGPRLDSYWSAFNPQNVPGGTLGKSTASQSLSHLHWERITLLILKGDWIKCHNAYKKKFLLFKHRLVWNLPFE